MGVVIWMLRLRVGHLARVGGSSLCSRSLCTQVEGEKTNPPKDMFMKIQDEFPRRNTLRSSNPVFDKRGRYQPQFYEAVELFLDNMNRNRVGGPLKNPCPTPGWNCEKEQGELFHWKDSMDEHGVTRIKIESDNGCERHIEIHWEHWMMLICQHDPNSRVSFELDTTDAKEFLRARKEAAAVEHFIMKNAPGTQGEKERELRFPQMHEMKEVENKGFHGGRDIPVEWMMAFKLVKWPKSFAPQYLDQVNYFDPFRRSEIIDRFRKFNFYHAEAYEGDEDGKFLKKLGAHQMRSDPNRYGKPGLRDDQVDRLRAEGARFSYEWSQMED